MEIDGFLVKGCVRKDTGSPYLDFYVRLEDGSEHKAEMILDSAIEIVAQITSEIYFSDTCAALVASLQANDQTDEQIQEIISNLLIARRVKHDLEGMLSNLANSEIQDNPLN